MTIIQRILILTTSFCLISCNGLKPEQIELLNRADKIKTYPLDRNALIQTFELEGLNSERSGGGGVRSGYIWFKESWEHPSGLTLTGYDSEYVGNIISRRNIDNSLNVSKIQRVLNAQEHKPRNSFENLEIRSNFGKTFYSRLSNPKRSQ